MREEGGPRGSGLGFGQHRPAPRANAWAGVSNPKSPPRAAGADTLLELLKNYARNAGLKSSLTVGVVGLPNVGKSSVINSLKRTRAAQV